VTSAICYSLTNTVTRRVCPYSDGVAGLTWSEGPESYARSSIATGRGSHTGQVKGETQTKTDTLVLQVGGWAWCWQPHPVDLEFVLKPQLKPRLWRKKAGEAMAGKWAEEEEQQQETS
jgi:hypothetical protein